MVYPYCTTQYRRVDLALYIPWVDGLSLLEETTSAKGKQDEGGGLQQLCTTGRHTRSLLRIYMENINESTKICPVADFVPAPEAVQGGGPAWEGLPSGAAERSNAVSPLQTIEPNHERLPPSGPDTPRFPTAQEDLLNGSPGELKGTLNKTCCEENGEGGSLRCPSSNENDATGASLTAQLEEGRAISACKDLQQNDADCATDPNISSPDRNPGEDKPATHAAGEQSSAPDVGIDDFQALLQAAMRQSDAQRAQDRNSARSHRRLQQASPRQNSPVQRQPDTSTPETIQSETTTSSNATSDCGQEEHKQSDPVCVPTDINSGGIESRSRFPVLTPASEGNNGEHQWVRYLSPEGYAYLYDEVTGDSKWVMSEEEEKLSLPPQEPTATTAREAEHGGQGSTGDGLSHQDGQTDLHCTAIMKTEERETTAYAAEGDSVDTCEVSQWSQDTSGPDAR